MADKPTATANIGVVGLAVMGSNLARNLASREGNTVAVYNRSPERTETADRRAPRGRLRRQRRHRGLRRLAREAAHRDHHGAGRQGHRRRHRRSSPNVFEPGDIIVDGGNALFTDTIRREKARPREAASTSSAPASRAARRARCKGPSIMPGGSDEACETLGPILESIAAVAEGEPCVTHIGTDGAGHFVKMIHNGIEYADMQLIAESYDLLRRVGGHEPADIAEVFDEWNEGDLESYLIEITAEVLRRSTPRPASRSSTSSSTRPARRAPASGPCRTRSTSACPSAASPRPSSPAPSRRSPSSAPRSQARIDVAPDAGRGRRRLRGRRPRRALRLEGRRLRAGLRRDHRRAPRSTAGTSTRAPSRRSGAAGCIIRAQFLNRIVEAYDENPELADPARGPVLRRRPSRTARPPGAASSRPPRCRASRFPASSSALVYYDSLASKRLPAALVQGQRDFFGAHTYQRVDKEGTFHTLWSGDRSEIEQDPSTH